MSVIFFNSRCAISSSWQSCNCVINWLIIAITVSSTSLLLPKWENKIEWWSEISRKIILSAKMIVMINYSHKQLYTILYFTAQHSTSHHTTSHHTASHHTTSHHITSHHITSHRTSLHHTTLHPSHTWFAAFFLQFRKPSPHQHGENMFKSPRWYETLAVWFISWYGELNHTQCTY